MEKEISGMMPCYCGVDVGAVATKVVLVDGQGEIMAQALRRSGIDFEQVALECFREVLEKSGVRESEIRRTVATGYGRANVSFSGARKTEIACHAKAAYYWRPLEITIVDIGGQDSKVIHLDADGRRKDFRMNRKCAAGTGAFLEEISLQLGVPLDRMNELALGAKEKVALGSYCTVFTKTEILTLARQGRSLEEIVRGVFDSVARRIIEMDPLDEGEVVMTGGVIAHNGVVAQLIEEKTGKKIFVPPLAQFAGAFGAALLALEEQGSGKK